MTKSPNKHNRIYCKAFPLDNLNSNLSDAIENQNFVSFYLNEQK